MIELLYFVFYNSIMKKIDVVKAFMKQNGSIIKTSQLNELGLKNSEIINLCNNRKLERIKHGYYKLTEIEEISEEKMIKTFFTEGIICMNSALFFYEYIDKTPSLWTVAFPRNYSRSKTKLQNFPCKIYYIQEKNFELGKTRALINNEVLNIYDRERVICDCFKYKSKIDSEIFNKAIHSYLNDKNRNLFNLSAYAKQMKIYTRLMEIMEVVINE